MRVSIVTFFLIFSFVNSYSQDLVLSTTGKLIIANPIATSSTLGVIRLAGDLSGTAASPTIADGAITTSKILDLAITNAKIGETIQVSKGGTGATTLSGYLKGNGINPIEGVATIPVNDISGAIKSVNGNLPDSSGNVSLSLVSVKSGVLTNRPTSGVIVGDMYVVSSDPTPANNGKFYIATSISPTVNWIEVTPNLTASDSKFLQLTGGTMNGTINVPASYTINVSRVPSNTVDVANKLYVDNLFSRTASTSTIGLMSPSDKSKLDNLPSGISLSSFSSKMVFWDGLVSPTLANSIYPYTNPPSFFGNPSFQPSAVSPTFQIPTTSEFKLTPTTSDNVGGMYWDFSLNPYLYVKFKYRFKSNSFGATNEHNFWFHLYSDAIPNKGDGTTSISGTHTKGYILRYSDLDQKFELFWGNSGVPLASSSTLNNSLMGNFGIVKFFVITSKLYVYVNDALVLTYLNPNTVNYTGTFFGFGATSNTNSVYDHSIGGISIEKYTQGSGGAISPPISDF